MPTLFIQKKILRRAAVALLYTLVLLTTSCLNHPGINTTHDNETVELLLLTTNDLHGRLEPFTIYRNKNPVLAGGFAGLAAEMNLVEQQNHGSVLRLNSGDTLTGPYAVNFNGKALFGALSRMNIDAATLGNHEFDHGPKKLAQALKHCSFPIILTNIDIPPDHILAQALTPFHIFKRAGKRLLVLGLITPDLPRISRPGPDITILDPGSSEVRLRIKKIIKKHEPDLVIALTHLGLEQDRRIAKRIPEIDIICGGHSHDLLPTGGEITVKHANGRSTVIVQAGAGGIALGVLRVILQSNTQPAYTWLPQEINALSDQCPRMLKFIETCRSGLPPTQALTTTDSVLDCRAITLRSQEAPIGNFIADSLRAHFSTDAALYNGGGIRGDFMLPAGPITSMDIETMLPFGNEAMIVGMTGSMLRQVLERSVANLPQPWGGFLHISGLRMQVDLRASSPSQRIISIDIQETGGEYGPLIPEKRYRIVTNSFLARGGNGYYQLRGAQAEPPTRLFIRDLIINQLVAQPHHSFQPDGRITIKTKANKR